MRVINMDHKLEVKGDASIHHEIKEKSALIKKSETGLSKAQAKGISAGISVAETKTPKSHSFLKRGGKMVSMVGGAIKNTANAAEATDKINNETVRFAKKTHHIGNTAVRNNAKPLKLAAKGSFKLRRLIIKKRGDLVKKKELKKAVDKSKLQKEQKAMLIAKNYDLSKEKKVKKPVYTSNLQKAKAAAQIANKYAFKPAARAVKKAGSTVDTIIEKVGENVDNDTVQFAKKSYDVAKITAKTGVKTANAAGKTIKTSVKVTRTLATKKSRKRLVKSVKRRVRNIKRNVKRAQKAAKATAKAAKQTAKLTAKIVKTVFQLVGRLASLISSTAPWSLILIAVITIVILMAYIVSNVFTEITGKSERAAGWVAGENDTESDIYDNFIGFADSLNQACEDKFASSLKGTITDFCGETEDPQKIIEYNGSVSFPAHGNGDRINGIIDKYLSSSSEYTSGTYANFMAALAVLTIRENGGLEVEYCLKKFTEDDFKKFIGGVNENSCAYGDTFFVKTTKVTSGETCPNENCKTEYRDDDCCSRVNSDGETEYYCGGHGYCEHDHEKLTVELKPVDQYFEKTLAEIYDFDEEEQEQFLIVSEFVQVILGDLERMENSTQEVDSVQ